MPGHRPPERRRGRSARHAGREPAAIGWMTPPVGSRNDSVVAVFERDRLSRGLAALHRERYGPHTRVLDGARGDLPAQLSRAGVEATLDLRGLTPDTALVLVNAPGRAVLVAALLSDAGAREVHVLGVSQQGSKPEELRDHDLIPPGSDPAHLAEPDTPTTG
ncbi:MAG: hypothetical protein M3Q71_03010 [Chloroflexota bacterium]|nr:hypothetical protein [Chloroflexota bacterium]MDP9469621.1 hypothetical protein [Chloroflexota bacterium]